jgi:hypothetical protein
VAAGDATLRSALQRAPVRRDGAGPDLLGIRERLGPRPGQPSKAGTGTAPGPVADGHARTWSAPSLPAELTSGLANGIGIGRSAEASAAERDLGVGVSAVPAPAASVTATATLPVPTSPQGPTTESLRSRLERLKQEKKIGI